MPIQEDISESVGWISIIPFGESTYNMKRHAQVLGDDRTLLLSAIQQTVVSDNDLHQGELNALEAMILTSKT